MVSGAGRLRSRASPIPGSNAIRVPKAVGVICRRAAISKAKGSTGRRIASPAAARRVPAVTWPMDWGTPMTAAVAAEMGIVMLSAVVPVKRSSPTCWVSSM